MLFSDIQWTLLKNSWQPLAAFRKILRKLGKCSYQWEERDYHSKENTAYTLSFQKSYEHSKAFGV
jgi:hypothetical protein